MAKFVLTVTGADDEVDPMDLITLSEQFPFVEWGILFSGTNHGQPCYPTKAWRSAFYDSVMSTTVPINTSAHLCGSFADLRLLTKEYLTTEVEMFFRRVQFNKFNWENSKQIQEYMEANSTPVVLPYNAKTAEILKSKQFEDLSITSVLFDASGGLGVAPTTWPDHLKGTFMCGYTGGITEENVENTLHTMTQRYGEDAFWIDLETGARDQEGKFSIPIVERILKKAEPFFGEPRIQTLTPRTSVVNESRIIIS